MTIIILILIAEIKQKRITDAGLMKNTDIINKN